MDHSYVLALDLSDRISPKLHPGQARRDLTVIQGVLGRFRRRVAQQLYVTSRDRLKVVVIPQAGIDYPLGELADDMRIDMRTIASQGKPGFAAAEARFEDAVQKLYAFADRSTNYTGANIPLFFRDQLAAYVEPAAEGREMRNILILLTDGYVELDAKVKLGRQDKGNRTMDMRLAIFRGRPNWEDEFEKGDHGLLVDRTDECGGMETLVMEMALHPRHQDDKNVLFKYWSKWLTEMGCRRNKLLLRDDSTAQGLNVLDQFLSGK